MSNSLPGLRFHPLVVAAVGLALLAAGAGVAVLTLPEWSPDGEGVSEERLVTALVEAVRGPEVSVEADAARIQMVSSSSELAAAWRAVGPGGGEILRSWDVGRWYRVEAPARWGEDAGNVAILFSRRLEPVKLEWLPGDLGSFLVAREGDREEGERLCRGVLVPDRELGDADERVGAQGVASIVRPVLGPGPEAHLVFLDLPGASVQCALRPGPAAASEEAVGGLSVGSFVAETARSLLPFVALAGLFFWLALRQRIDLVNGLVLAVVAVILNSVGFGGGGVPGWFSAVLTSLWYGTVVFLLWSTAESVARSSLPGFSTSLDALLRGAVGPRGGASVLRGLGGGMGMAGVWLGTLGAVAEGWLGPAMPERTSVDLPLLSVARDPFTTGVIWAGAVVLVYALAANLAPEALAVLVAGVAIGVGWPPVALEPWLGQALAGIVLSAALAAMFRRLGLSAALVAAVTFFLAPEAVVALADPSWLWGTLAASWAWIGGLAVVGIVGIRRSGAKERRVGGPPAFVRRLERRRRLEYEMDLLSRMQTGLLPATLPRVPGYEITARSLLATEASGDLYDFLRDDRGGLWVAAGDVSGHGFSCAIAQATVKAALVSQIGRGSMPAEVLAGVDEVLRATLSERQFTSLCLARLEPRTGKCVIANAGHPFPVLVTEGQAREVSLPGLPLGQGPGRVYREAEVTIPPEGLLVLYSDGLAEARDGEGEAYGFDRPARMIERAAGWNAAEVLDRLLSDWRVHLDGASPDDDTTVVVVRRMGAPRR